MTEAFEFEDSGRTYTCTVEAPRHKPTERRWWFAVSHDAQRYSPFEAATGDSKKSVQERVLAFYNHRLYCLSQPTEVKKHWGGRPKGSGAAATAAAAELDD